MGAIEPQIGRQHKDRMRDLEHWQQEKERTKDLERTKPKDLKRLKRHLSRKLKELTH